MPGYINGSDVLLMVGEKCVGHCTSHTLTFNSESKERAVKPVASANIQLESVYKEKKVTGKSITVKAEGLRNYEETENGFAELLDMWHRGSSVLVKAYNRADSTSPYLKGQFIISNMEETSPAGDDTTYTITLENDGAPEIVGFTDEG